MRFSTNQFGLSLVLVIIKWSASRRCMLCLSMKVRPELPSSGYCYEWNKFQSETSFNVVGSLLGFTVGKEEEQVFGGSHSLPNIWCGGNSPIISSLRGEIWQVESFAHNINKAEVFLAVKQSNLTFVKSTPARPAGQAHRPFIFWRLFKCAGRNMSDWIFNIAMFHPFWQALTS